ncbi:MAG: sodium:solute symporter family protein [Candidatus Cardinium sp.]|uniref:sodium:solute symporter family protein n=1 Tax=Cardinium endosymbiont of Dermatophagoides farinae TaxID=2597823 RepID=UPI0011825414|nr:sodium:solute symporter family protein [Cardinium endosymbiont of Dermatophagoides farinae]TSJ80952.1 sodium:solute symporter family protein [Cardinium endosymbiont of Dermatophagoides farinae]UWW96978.1 MAG: sodium:solute symporter family protein [Candidatus Cardinium sp.]
MLFDTLLFIVIVFLLSVSLVAFYATRRPSTTFRAYAMGNRAFSTANLVATALATYYGGATLMGYVTQFSDGLFWLSWRIFGIIAVFFTLSWLGMRMSKFSYHISMPETMGRLYGKYPRIITALLSVCYSTVVIAMQIHIMAQGISMCIDSVSPLCITVVTTLLLVTYSIFGGIRAVILTDVWQCIIFSSLICVLAWFMFQQTNASFGQTIAFAAAQKKFGLGHLFLYDRKVVATLRYLATMVNCIEPAFIQHVYIASSPSQAKKMFLYAGIFGCMLMVCFSLVGLFIFSWVPSNLSGMEIWNYIMVYTPPLLKGVICTCLLAMNMSTADSRLHICAVMISYDILPNILPFRKNISSAYHYRMAHMAILFITTLAIPLALSSNYFIVDKVVLWYSRLYVPVVVAPFILAVLGFRTRTALIGMVAGALAVFAWRKWIFPILGTNDGVFPCMLINGLVMLAAHYLLPKSKRIKELNDDPLKQI